MPLQTASQTCASLLPPGTLCRLEQRLRGISRWGADGDEGIVQCVEFFQDRGDTVVLVSGAYSPTAPL